MNTTESMDTPHTLAPHPGEPEPTASDPTAGGYYCGSNRSPKQIAAAIEDGKDPWPYCRRRAGQATGHVGMGRCSNHGGSTANHRASARIRLAELVGPSFAVIAALLTDQAAPKSVRLRAAQDVLDRAGYPRHIDIDVDGARESLYERLLSLQASDESTS